MSDTIKAGNEQELARILTACWKARVSVLLMGRPGISKSTTSINLARQLAGRVSSIVLPEDTPVAELRGFYMPGADGKFHWADGPVTTAIRNGGAVILDELSHLSPEAQTFMHAALDSSPVTLPTGETLNKHANYWCIATQNDSEDALRPALRDRFPVRITVINPPSSVYAALPADLREPARRQVEGEKGSLRPWFAFAQLRDHMPHNEAAELIWHGRGEEMVTALALNKYNPNKGDGDY